MSINMEEFLRTVEEANKYYEQTREHLQLTISQDDFVMDFVRARINEEIERLTEEQFLDDTSGKHLVDRNLEPGNKS